MEDEVIDRYTLLKKFQQLQDERVQTFRIFNEGHKIYLQSAPNYEFGKFRTIVHEVTQEFKRIAQDVITVERKLRQSCDKSSLADFIRNVQNEEKLKLELTTRLQLAKQGMIDHPDEHERQISVLGIKEQLHQVIERINEHLEEIRYEEVELQSL